MDMEEDDPGVESGECDNDDDDIYGDIFTAPVSYAKDLKTVVS